MMSGEDVFEAVRHDAPFPPGAVRAMNRGLRNEDEPWCTDSYVALWYKNSEACFGRAHNRHGKVVAYFPWGGQEHASDNLETFYILLNKDPALHYSWVPLEQAKPHTLVTVGGYSPCVVRGVECVGGEMLGKVHREKEEAHTCYYGEEYRHQDEEYQTSYVLSRQTVPTPGYPELPPPSYNSTVYGAPHSSRPPHNQRDTLSQASTQALDSVNSAQTGRTLNIPQHGYLGAFMLKSKMNGKVMEVEGSGGSGSPVVCSTVRDPGSPNQLWKYESAGNGWYWITSCLSPNLVLDVQGGKCLMNSKVIVTEKSLPPCASQLWKFHEGFMCSYLATEAAMGRSMVLDIHFANVNDGAKVIIYPSKDYDSANQEWTMVYD